MIVPCFLCRRTQEPRIRKYTHIYIYLHLLEEYTLLLYYHHHHHYFILLLLFFYFFNTAIPIALVLLSLLKDDE